MFSYSTGYYVSPPVDQYLKFKNRCSLLCIAQNTDNVIFVIEKNIMHCKWRDGENSISMSGSHLCFPRNETVQPPYVKNSIIMFCLPIPTLIYLWEIYIFPRLVCPQYFAAAKYVEYINLSQTHECGNWDWGRAIPKKGIHKWDFRCSAANFYTLNSADQQHLLIHSHVCHFNDYYI